MHPQRMDEVSVYRSCRRPARRGRCPDERRAVGELRQGGQGGARNPAQGKTCLRCGKPNHFARDCHAKTDKEGKWLGENAALKKATPGNVRRMVDENDAEEQEDHLGAVRDTIFALGEWDQQQEVDQLAVKDPWKAGHPRWNGSRFRAFEEETKDDEDEGDTGEHDDEERKGTDEQVGDRCVSCEAAGVYDRVFSGQRWSSWINEMHGQNCQEAHNNKTTAQTPVRARPTMAPHLMKPNRNHGSIPAPIGGDPEDDLRVKSLSEPTGPPGLGKEAPKKQARKKASKARNSGSSKAPQDLEGGSTAGEGEVQESEGPSAESPTEDVWYDPEEFAEEDQSPDIIFTVGEEAKGKPRGRLLVVTVDSGCTKSCGPVSLGEGREVEETPQSKAGHAFMGPGGEKYKNVGKATILGKNEAGKSCQVSMHMAQGVRQALGSVAESNDAGNMVVFDSTGEHHGSGIIRADSAEGKIIREAMRRALTETCATKIHRVKNSYEARIWIDEPMNVKANDAPFAGQRA